MKKKIMGLVMGIMLIGVNLFAADGDVIVNGNIEVGGAIKTAGLNSKIRYGSGSVTVNIAAGASATKGPFSLGYTFSSVPKVMVIGTNFVYLNPITVEKTETEFKVKLFNAHPSSTASGTYNFDWIAIGE